MAQVIIQLNKNSKPEAGEKAHSRVFWQLNEDLEFFQLQKMGGASLVYLRQPRDMFELRKLRSAATFLIQIREQLLRKIKLSNL